MLPQSHLGYANVYSATRTPIPIDLLNKWQKRVGKKASTPCTSPSPSPVNDSDGDFPIPAPRLIKYATRSSLAAGDTISVAGPSNLLHSVIDDTEETTSNRHGADVIEIEGTFFHSFTVSQCIC